MRRSRSRTPLFAVPALVGALWAGSLSGAGSVAQANGVSPPPRFSMALAEDPNGHVVLFGGRENYGYLGDTWTWDGTTWTEQHPETSPSARGYTGAAFDVANRQVVMFGGIDDHGAALDETWTWDGTTWTQQHPEVSPPACCSLGMAYDAARQQVVLFGGGAILGETWTWDGTTWTQQNPIRSPPGRGSPGMAYDAVTQRVVLFGGVQGVDEYTYLRDTWTWDGSTWTKQRPTGSPSERAGVGLAGYLPTGEIVLFGGHNNRGILSGTGVWDGANWIQQVPAVSPSSRYATGMAYDRISRQVVLFGGYGPKGPGGLSGPLRDTWTWEGSTWTKH